MEFAIAWFALVAVALFFFLVRPQRRQIAAHRMLVDNLEVGDEVITAGGLYGTIRALRDDVIELEVADGVVVRMARAAIARAVGSSPESDSEIDGELDGETA